MATAHISAEKGQIAKTVVMPGDPLRAQEFAKNFLTDVVKINEVRGMLGFTGKTKSGKEITVMGHGMGLDSIGIYVYELYEFYDVENIIRFGSCGSYNTNIKVWDVIIAKEAWTSSNYGDGFGAEGIDTLPATQELLEIAKQSSEELDLDHPVHFTKVNSSPWFYKTSNIDNPAEMVSKGIDVVEMEIYALYAIARVLNKKALGILTVSDHIVEEVYTTSMERQTGFIDMFKIIESIIDKI